MHSPLWPNRAVKPPYGAVEIDWSHPLAKGLVAYSLMNEGAGAPASLAGAATSTLVGAWKGSAVGPCIDFGNSTADIVKYTGTRNTFAAGGDCTIGGLVRAEGYGGGGYGRICQTASSGAEPFLGVTNSGVAACFVATANTTLYYTGANTLVIGTWQFAVMTFSDATNTLRIYINGVLARETNSASESIPATAVVSFGNRDYDKARAFDGQIAVGIAANRAWSAVEVAQWSADPYCLLRPVLRRSYGWKAAGAAPTFKAAWARHANQIIQVGL